METVAASFAPAAAEAGRTLVVESGPPLVAYADATACARRSTTSSRTPCTTAPAPSASAPAPTPTGSRCTSATRAAASRRLPAPRLRSLRARRRRAAVGSGLGLAIVAAVAAAHGGSAHAENGPDGGADVWIALPSPDGEPFIAVS